MELLRDYKSIQLGTLVCHSRLKWKVNTTKDGFHQSAYHVTVGIDSTQVGIENSDIWDRRGGSSLLFKKAPGTRCLFGKKMTE